MIQSKKEGATHFNSNTTIRTLERWSIVGTVTSHDNQGMTILKRFDDLLLVFRVNFTENGSLYKVMNGRAERPSPPEMSF